MNSENSKTSNPHRLLLNLSDKVNLKGNDKYVALCHRKIMNLIYQLQSGMINLNYLTDHILYQIFKNTIKKHGEKTDNPLIRIYV